MRAELDIAERRRRDAEGELANSGPLHRRAARHTLAAANDDVTTARTALDELSRRAQPLLDQRRHLHTEREQLHDRLTNVLPLTRKLNRTDEQLAKARRTVEAVDTWHRWAAGHDITPAALINTAHRLTERGGHHAALAAPLTTWIHEHDIAPRPSIAPQSSPDYHSPRPQPQGLGIEL